MIRSLSVMLLVAAAVMGALRFANALASVDVTKVRVTGELTSAEGLEVQGAVESSLARSGLRSAAVVADAVQALSWVRDVHVRRLWPDVLQVHVSRETLAARWGEVGHTYLTTGGNVVSLPGSVGEPLYDTLPVLEASHVGGAQAMRLNTLLNEAARSGGLQIDRLEQDDAGNWTATLAAGAEVVLGATDLGERFERFLVVYRQILGDDIVDVERIDARYETGVAVRWRQDDDAGGAPEAGPAQSAGGNRG